MTAVRDLQKYELSPVEWGIAEELKVILKIFKDATLFFSRGTPNLATVIPAMDHIDKVLSTASDSQQYSLPICASLVVGKNVINRYYNKTDQSEVYHIAMILHLQHKLAYFKVQDWEEPWIEMAYTLVCEEYDRSYDAPAGVDGNDTETDDVNLCSVDSVCVS
ncbi:hypothetical protein H4582DRAFT_1805462 [Lactarius indigo]|nr:hypothetical protein H4582DRAFT_1805462 [Lactarius indigo]